MVIENPHRYLLTLAANDVLLGVLLLIPDRENHPLFVKQEFLASLAENISMALQNTILYSLGIMDRLTKLYNREYVTARSREEKERFARDSKRFAVLMIDLDHFKMVNDTYGHLTGDTVLAEFAVLLRNTLRRSDVAARYGGEEFLALLPGTEESGARELAQRIRLNCEKTEFTTPEGKRLKVTVSIGAAIFEDTDESLEGLIHRADTALYQAKNQGRNTCCLAPQWDHV